MGIIYGMFHFLVSSSPLLLKVNSRVFLPFWKQFELRETTPYALLTHAKCWVYSKVLSNYMVDLISFDSLSWNPSQNPLLFLSQQVLRLNYMTNCIKFLLYFGDGLTKPACAKWLPSSALTILSVMIILQLLYQNT